MKFRKEFFYFEPYVHINHQNDKALLYNTFTNKYEILNNKILLHQIQQNIQNHTNGFFLNSPLEKEICCELRNNYFGEIITINPDEVPPFVLPTEFLKVEKNKEFLETAPYRNISENIISCLFELDLYIDNPYQDDDIYCKQLPSVYFPTSEKEKGFTDFFSQIEVLCNSSNLNKINIFISRSNVENLHFLNELKNKLDHNKLVLHFNIENAINYTQIDDDLTKLVYYSISFHSTENKIKKFNFNRANNFKIVFLIEDEEQISIADEIVSTYKIIDYDYKPLFNGNNIDLFKDCVFLDEESILSEKINKNQIFRNKEINAIDFGRIVIFNDGQYCTNNLLPPLGNVENDDVRQILNNCISSESSTWFLTRNNVSICKDCIYNQLCPPISNYEHVIGKFNLCNIS
ncbi:MAG: hypothetical protein K8R31_12540 [Bacteroidales bacterium]|nr:hypothetical protein [Bacteroidales bacterium]